MNVKRPFNILLVDDDNERHTRFLKIITDHNKEAAGLLDSEVASDAEGVASDWQLISVKTPDVDALKEKLVSPAPGRDIDALIVDLTWGQDNAPLGLELIKTGRKASTRMPIIAISNTSERSVRVASMTEGANYFLFGQELTRLKSQRLEFLVLASTINQERSVASAEREHIENLYDVLMGYAHDVARQSQAIETIIEKDKRNRALQYLRQMNERYLSDLKAAKTEGSMSTECTEVTNLGPIIRAVAHDMSPFLAHRYDLVSVNGENPVNISIEEIPETGLPAAIQESDARRILENVLDNAIKVQRSGYLSLVRAYNEAGQTCVEVHDAGPGFDDCDIKYAFLGMYRGKRMFRSGFGCGLAAVRVLLAVVGPKGQSGKVVIGTSKELGGAMVQIVFPA